MPAVNPVTTPPVLTDAVPVSATIDQVPPACALVNAAVVALIQTEAAPPPLVDKVGNVLTVILVVLLTPVITGVLLTTLMRYKVPATVDEGIVAVMVPAAVLVRVPIATGLVNAPALLLSCAVNTLPAVKLPEMV